MATPANATYKLVQRKFRDMAKAVRVVYVSNGRPARRVLTDRGVQYVPR